MRNLRNRGGGVRKRVLRGRHIAAIVHNHLPSLWPRKKLRTVGQTSEDIKLCLNISDNE